MKDSGIYKLGQSSDYVGKPCQVCQKELKVNDRVIFGGEINKKPLTGARHADCEPKKKGGGKANA